VNSDPTLPGDDDVVDTDIFDDTDDLGAVDEFDDDHLLDDPIEAPPSGSSADRYKRRVESRPAPTSTGGRGKALATAVVLLAGIAGLLLWLQPWSSAPLDVKSVQNERVDLVELIGANGCFWRFDVEIANTVDERVWITSVELFLNDELVRPDIAYGFIDPGVESSIPVEIFLGDTGGTGVCPAARTIDHSKVDVVHATIGDIFTAGTTF
jgi:hypothetical protein